MFIRIFIKAEAYRHRPDAVGMQIASYKIVDNLLLCYRSFRPISAVCSIIDADHIGNIAI